MIKYKLIDIPINKIAFTFFEERKMFERHDTQHKINFISVPASRLISSLTKIFIESFSINFSTNEFIISL